MIKNNIRNWKLPVQELKKIKYISKYKKVLTKLTPLHAPSTPSSPTTSALSTSSSYMHIILYPGVQVQCYVSDQYAQWGCPQEMVSSPTYQLPMVASSSASQL